MTISLYSSRIILKNLGIDDFGIYSVVAGFMIAFEILNGAMRLSSQRYMILHLEKNDPVALRSVFNSSFQLHLIVGIIAIVIGEFVGIWFIHTQMTISPSRVGAATWAFHLTLLTFVLDVLVVPYNACVVSREKFSLFAYATIADSIVRLIAAVIIPFTGSDPLIAYSFAMFAMLFILRGAFIVFCTYKFPECHPKLEYNRNQLHEMSSFAGWGLIEYVTFFSNTQGVNILLNLFFGPSVNAARAVSVRIQMAVLNLCTNFQSAINPQISKSYFSNELERTRLLVNASSRFSFYVVLFLSTPVLISTPFILKFWLGSIPDHSASFLRIMLAISLITCLENPLGVAMQASGRIKLYQISVGAIQILVIPVSYLCFRLWNFPEAAFLIQFILSVVSLFVRVRISTKTIGSTMIDYFKTAAFPNSFVAALMIGGSFLCDYALKNPPNFLGFAINTITSTLIGVIAVALVGTNANERQFIKARIFRLLKSNG